MRPLFLTITPLRVLQDNLLQESDRWMLWTPVGIAIGIALYFALPFEPTLYALALTPLLGLMAWQVRYRLPLLVPLFIASTIAAGFNASQIETRLFYTPMLEREQGPLPVRGRLMYTEVMPKGVRLTLKDLDIGRMPPKATPAKIRIRLNNKTIDDVPPPGSRIRVYAQIGPFSEPVMPHATDFRWQGYFRQLGGLGWSYSSIDVIDPHPASASWRDDFSLMFERARMTLARHVYARLSGDVAAMTVTRLNGEQAGISEPVIEAMRIAGLSHLLSTSGFHVTIMGLLVYFPLRALLALMPWVALRYPIKKWAATGAILSTLGYTFLVGSQAATLRSMIMIGIAMLAILLNRRSAPMRLVMLSATLAMLLAPDAALGPSFQMSFAAVFCLIASHRQSLRWLISPDGAPPLLSGWLLGVVDHLATIVTTSLIATAATTPFALYHFQTFSFYGFVANTLAIPMTSFWVMPCILAAYIFAPFGWDDWFIDGAGAGIALTIKIAQLVAHWPYSILYLPAMPWGSLVGLTFGGLWLCIWQRRWRWLGLIPILAGAVYPLYTPLPDVMIAPNAKAWAARLPDGRLAVSRLGHDQFVYNQWQQRLGNPPLVDARELADDAPLRCDDLGCVITLGKDLIALPMTESALLEDCELASVVVATALVRDCQAKHILDEPRFWFHGAHALYQTADGLRIASSRSRRAMRPWSPGWYEGRERTTATLGDRDDD